MLFDVQSLKAETIFKLLIISLFRIVFHRLYQNRSYLQADFIKFTWCIGSHVLSTHSRNDTASGITQIPWLFNSFSALAYSSNDSDAASFLNNLRQVSLWSRTPLLIEDGRRSHDCSR